MIKCQGQKVRNQKEDLITSKNYSNYKKERKNI